MSVELMPCPWEHLGGRHLQSLRHHSGYVYVECNCGARGPGSLNKELALTAWNHRTPDPRLEVAVEALERIKNTHTWIQIGIIVDDTLAKIKGC